MGLRERIISRDFGNFEAFCEFLEVWEFLVILRIWGAIEFWESLGILGSFGIWGSGGLFRVWVLGVEIGVGVVLGGWVWSDLRGWDWSWSGLERFWRSSLGIQGVGNFEGFWEL